MAWACPRHQAHSPRCPARRHGCTGGLEFGPVSAPVATPSCAHRGAWRSRGVKKKKERTLSLIRMALSTARRSAPRPLIGLAAPRRSSAAERRVVARNGVVHPHLTLDPSSSHPPPPANVQASSLPGRTGAAGTCVHCAGGLAAAALTGSKTEHIRRQWVTASN